MLEHRACQSEQIQNKTHRSEMVSYRFLESPAQIVVKELIQDFRPHTELLALRVRVNLERPDFLDQRLNETCA